MILTTALYKNLLRPLLFKADPESVHDLAMATAGRVSNSPWLCSRLRSLFSFDHASLAVQAAGINFAHPIGLAAGWDKNGRGIPLWEAIGFGHVEIGSISADFSAGNPKPRLFRVPQDRAIVVNYGLPNDGAERVAHRLENVRSRLKTPLGINIVNTNRGPAAGAESDEQIVADFVQAINRLEPQATYLVLNLSCPNTGEGRAFVSDPNRVRKLMRAVAALHLVKPLFLKVAPFSDPATLDSFIDAVHDYDFVRGFSINLPSGKPACMTAPRQLLNKMPGAVSGWPSEAAANHGISEIYRRIDPRRHIIIASGGVFTAADAWRKIQLGATLVQCLTAVVYEGPAVIGTICEGLAAIAREEGLKRIQDGVGTAKRE